MTALSTTKMSSKGQVVIPEEIRDKMGLKSGTKFVVMGNKDYVVLKTLEPPSLDELEELIKQTRKQVRKLGIKKSDVSNAIKKARRNKS